MDYLNNQHLRSLFIKGIDTSYNNCYRDNTETAQFEHERGLFLSNENISAEVFDDLADVTKSNILKFYIKSEIDLYKNKKWAAITDRIAEELRCNFESDSSSVFEAFSYHNRNVNYRILASHITKSFDWTLIVKRVLDAKYEYIVHSCGWDFVVREWGSGRPEGLKTLVEDNCFSTKNWPYRIRSKMYKEYIDKGFLTTKTARKIRSEPSEAASLAGLKSLMSNMDNYNNADQLIIQFVDTKYPDVARHLAEKIPMSMIGYMVSTDDYYAKKVVQGRLEKSLAEKNSNEEELGVL